MFEKLTSRAERTGRERARVRSAALAERLRAGLPSDVEVEAASDGLRLSGPSIGTRLAWEPSLRWLAEQVK